ncbi:hypothetical protein XACG102_10730002 [Xanthomonas citri pv. citri]|nr:hypothetical protein XACG102_10730002 [Xanthomonas citri pv. citri]
MEMSQKLRVIPFGETDVRAAALVVPRADVGERYRIGTALREAVDRIRILVVARHLRAQNALFVAAQPGEVERVGVDMHCEHLASDVASGCRHVAICLTGDRDAPYGAIVAELMNVARLRARRGCDQALEVANLARTRNRNADSLEHHS